MSTPPPEQVRFLNGQSRVLDRLRFVTRGFRVKPLDVPHTTWRITYLNNDETELSKEEGLVRGRGAIGFHLHWTAVTSQVWDDIHQLPPDYVSPAWDTLLLDAANLLPEIGPPVVLAATALEVFISYILNELAERSTVPRELWTWINNRGDGIGWLREPTVEEQFDMLLHVLLGISLKENNRLWEAFRHLRQARNSFVHGGRARIGKQVLTAEDAQRLIPAAVEIIRFIRDRLPEDMQWPIYRHNLNIKAMKPFN
jgi:hypothetical protein